jgi:signal transduction histidine kinase/HAMP domain-containing protein
VGTFTDASIKQKLILVPMLTSAVTVGVAGILYLSLDVVSLRREMRRDLATLAQIVGANSSAALVFRDDETASQILASLAARENIVAAFLYTPEGKPLARYVRRGSRVTAPTSGEAPVDAPRGLLAENSPIVVAGQRVGTITIFSDLREVNARISRAASLGLLVVLASLVVGYLVSTRLQRVISEPVVHLAETAKRISEHKDFSVRAVASSRDELGLLTRTFNEMLVQIQSRDLALTRLSSNVKQLYQLSTAMQEPLSSPEHLTRILQSARSVLAVDGLATWVMSSDGKTLKVLAGAGDPLGQGQSGSDLRIPIGTEGLFDELFRLGEPSIYDEQHPIPPELQLWFRGAGAPSPPPRCFVTVPMIARGRPVGLLTADNQQSCQPIARETADVLQIFASHAAIAIENARLFHELEEKSLQLGVASRHKSQFLANMSHELRTPLNAILGYTELIRDNIYGEVPGRIKEVLERVDLSGRHLLALINQVLDLSKIEAGHLTLATGEYSMTELVQTVVTSMEALAAEKDLALAADIAPRLPPGVGDERRLTQVLLNLVGNAVKFTDRGEVRVKVRAVDGSFNIAVADTGPGISDVDQRRIFEEFHQGDSAASKKKSGTGLGLTIAKKIVEMHGGALWVDSTLGRGSTFWFTVPIRAAQKGGSAA